MAGIFCRLKGKSFAASLKTVISAEKKYPFCDPFLSLVDLEIPLELYRSELEEFQNKYLQVFEDAVDLIKTLKAKKYNLYITSNNSRGRAYAILHRAGLSDWEHSKYFSNVFCPETIGFNKSNIQFYQKVIETANFNPEEILVIGDTITDDSIIPLKAGIGQAVIVDRNHKFETKDAFIVNDLRSLTGKGKL
jgi:HAD superfamily hydrolase (TIGR01549 family)